jgi:hypothetical protein
VSPILISLLRACSRRLSGSVHACQILGIDLGPVLYAMGLAVWFMAFTMPLALVALIVLIIVNVVKRRRPRSVDATDKNA